MLKRIQENEERLDKIIKNSRKLQEALDLFESNINDIFLLKKYYSSKKWIQDKENYEYGNIPKIKAGVLSEDAVWNLLDDITDIKVKMQNIIEKMNQIN